MNTRVAGLSPSLDSLSAFPFAFLMRWWYPVVVGLLTWAVIFPQNGCSKRMREKLQGNCDLAFQGLLSAQTWHQRDCKRVIWLTVGDISEDQMGA